MVVAGLLVSLAPSAYAAFPGDNGRIAYVCPGGPDGVGVVCTVAPDGSNRLELSDLTLREGQSPRRPTTVRWSSGSKRLMVGAIAETITAAPNGTDRRTVISTYSREQALRSDGEWVALIRDSLGGDLYFRRYDGSDERSEPTTWASAK